MPFNKNTAASHGSKGGNNRWKDKDPATVRNKPLLIKLTPTEYDTITNKAIATGLSKAELIIRAIKTYKN